MLKLTYANVISEVEGALTVENAEGEARRCLRCDLEFTQPKEIEEECIVKEGELT